MRIKTFLKSIVGLLVLLPLFTGCKAEKPEVPEVKLDAPIVEAEFDGEKVILK